MFKAFLIKFVLIAVPPVNDTISAEIFVEDIQKRIDICKPEFSVRKHGILSLSRLDCSCEQILFTFVFIGTYNFNTVVQRRRVFCTYITVYDVVNKIFIEKL